ncbi:MAG: 3-oxoacyl-ACP reductase FabG [Pseudomonadota bacterium]
MRRALVTGGASPIGAAICRALAADGFRVGIHAHRSIDRATTLAAEITAAGGAADAVAFDITDAAATRATITGLLEAGPIQVLVHNAGIHDDVPFAGMTEQQWHDVIDVSLNGFHNVAGPMMLPMIGTRWGRIVAITSVAALMGNRGQVAYAAAKAGLHGAVRALSLECASRGVTVNAVAPGVIDTPATQGLLDRASLAALIPMKRAGRPEEVADLVGFLASDRAAYISGQIISINGGMA